MSRGIFKDITGLRFGRLVVLSVAGKLDGAYTWLCKCDCGVEKTCRGPTLRSGLTKSCGCLSREVAAARATTHGCTRNGRKAPEYGSYRGMLARCHDPRHPHFANYGGRGIHVCDRWRTGFAFFLADMGPRPEGTTLDRWPNNDGNYEPGNCRWATNEEQHANKRTTEWVTIRGRTLTITQWKRELGVEGSALGASALRAVVAYLDAPESVAA